MGGTGGLYFRVLGPLTVERDGAPVDLGGPQRRLVLALLLAHANATVSVDVLVDALWGEAPPPSFRVQLQGLVSDLRRRLAPGDDRGAAPIVTRAPGYLLEVPEEHLDLAQFRAEVAAAAQARADGEHATAVRLLRAALDRWRGPAFCDIASPALVHRAAAVDELRVAALAESVDAQLADGRVAELGAELVRLVAEYPLHERFHGQLMTVYARTGRPADALTVYRELRRRMAAELGIEPSGELRELHRQILSGAFPGASDVPTATGTASAYRQLPPDIAEFTGRKRELSLLLGAGGGDGTAVPVVVVEGMAGVGKTRLAVHAAHQLVRAGRYRDGQLYVDLRGFAPDADPAGPGEVLDSFLRLLGVPPDGVPPDVASRAAVFRDRLAGLQVVLVLDNAADESQVLPLLPADPGCLVIVTSRRSLDFEGARTVRLDVFRPDEAAGLLSAVLGAERVAADPAAVADLAARCGYLPLAVALAARRLRARPAWPVRHLLSRLADEGRRLDELSVGGRAVESVFALSYQALDPERRRLFRLLGIHPGHDVTAQSVAALAKREPSTVEVALESLLDEHLVLQAVPGRYHLHDLVRAYAERLCEREDSAAQRKAALQRVLDWYVRGTAAATRLARRFSVPVLDQFPIPPGPAPEITDEAQAVNWLDTEYPNLVAVMQLAGSGPWAAHALQLPHMLQPYLITSGRIEDWIAGLHLAEAVAIGLGHTGAWAHTLTSLGEAYNTIGQTERALTVLQQALALHQRIGQRDGEAATLNYLGVVHRRFGRRHEAIDEFRAAAELFRELGDDVRVATVLSNISIELHLLGRDDEALRTGHEALDIQRRLTGRGEASLRTNLGLIYAHIGRYAEAVEQTRRALALHRAAASVPGEATTLANLAYSYARLGRHDDAVAAGVRAVELARQTTDPETLAATLNALGEAYHLAGDDHAAVRHHREALALAERIGDEEERVRANEGLAGATSTTVSG
jgi:DNA-binding SARP family transcriptional activator/tetratricopeptide (TPR) repeat protein